MIWTTNFLLTANRFYHCVTMTLAIYMHYMSLNFYLIRTFLSFLYVDPTTVLVRTDESNQNRGTKIGTRPAARFSVWFQFHFLRIRIGGSSSRTKFFFWPSGPTRCCSAATGLWTRAQGPPMVQNWTVGDLAGQLASNGLILDHWRPGDHQQARPGLQAPTVQF